MSKARGVVATVMAFFKAGDEGKVNWAYDRFESAWQREVKRLQHNIKTLTFEYEAEMQKLNDSMEDAQLARVDIWKDVNPDTVGKLSSSDWDRFQSSFESSLDASESLVDSIQKDIDALNKSHGETIKDVKANILLIQERLDIINEPVVTK